MKTSFGKTSPDNSWVYLGSTGFCQFFVKGTAGHILVSKISDNDVSFICLDFLSDHWVYSPQHCPFLCASSKRLEQHILKLKVFSEVEVWAQFLCWQALSLWTLLCAHGHCHARTTLDPLIPVKGICKATA